MCAGPNSSFVVVAAPEVHQRGSGDAEDLPLLSQLVSMQCSW